jgi:proteic killer suppression protein
MIRSFRCQETRALHEGFSSRRFRGIEVRINDRWRICFSWREGNAHDVEIVDYH